MRNMNKSLVCVLFVLLGVAESFANDRVAPLRYRRSNTFSKASLGDREFIPIAFKRHVRSARSQTDNPDNESSTNLSIEDALNEVESTVAPLSSSISSTTVLKDLTTTSASTPASTLSSTTISTPDLSSRLNTESLPNLNLNTPSRTPASDAITNSSPKSPSTPNAASSNNIPYPIDSGAVGSFSQSSSGPNSGGVPNGGSFPSRGSFSNVGSSSTNFAPNPGYGNFGPQPGPNFPSAPGFSSQGFTFPGGSGFTSTFTSGSGSGGGSASAGSFAGAGASSGSSAPSFLSRGAFEEPSDFGYPSGSGANPFPQGPHLPNNPGFNFPTGPGNDFQIFDQYFRNIQRENEIFQQQIQQQIQQQQSGRYSWASSMSYITNPSGVSDPNASVYAYSATSPEGGIASSHVDSKMGYGVSKSTVSGNSNIFEMSNRLGNGGFPSGEGSYGGNYGPQSAYASASLGPQGGFQAGQVSPAAPGIFSRFGESIPPPSGNSFGVFTSSSSHQSVGPDGIPKTFKSSTTGVNDNGKITFRTVHDP